MDGIQKPQKKLPFQPQITIMKMSERQKAETLSHNKRKLASHKNQRRIRKVNCN